MQQASTKPIRLAKRASRGAAAAGQLAHALAGTFGNSPHALPSLLRSASVLRNDAFSLLLTAMDLTTDFDRAQTAYADRLSYALAHRHTEQWSNGPLLHAEPFDFERLGLAPSKELPQEPAATQHTYDYWLNEQGSLLAVRKGLALPNQFYEEFFFSAQGLVKSCLYSNTGGVENVKTRVMEQGRVREVFLLGRRRSKHETFHYEGDVLLLVGVYCCCRLLNQSSKRVIMPLFGHFYAKNRLG